MIYIIQEQDSGDTKIGWSINPEVRIRTLQGERTGKLEILRTLAAPRWAEFWFHRQFKVHRIAREWFRFHPDMLIIEPPDEKPERDIAPVGSIPPPLNVRLNPDQLGRLRAMAAAEDRPLSVMARILIDRGLRGGPDYQGQPSGPPSPSPSFSHGRGVVSVEERRARAVEVTTRFKSGAKV